MDAPPVGEAVFVAGDELAAGDAPEAGDAPAAGDAPPAAGEAPVAGLGDAAHTTEGHGQKSAYSREPFLCSSTLLRCNRSDMWLCQCLYSKPQRCCRRIHMMAPPQVRLSNKPAEGATPGKKQHEKQMT